jgi:hypothetical protein
MVSAGAWLNPAMQAVLKSAAVLLLLGCSLAAQPIARNMAPERATAQPEHMTITVAPVDEWYQSLFGNPRYGFLVGVRVRDTFTDAANICVTFKRANSAVPETRCQTKLRNSIPTEGFISAWFYVANDAPPIAVSARATLLVLAGATNEVHFD